MIAPVSAVGGEWSVGGVGGLNSSEGASTVPSAGEGSTSGSVGGSEGGFGGALTNAISSLEQTQQNAASASQGLALGTVSDPERAVVTVQDAQLAMQLASQIRTKATEAAQTIFQTQV